MQPIPQKVHNVSVYVYIPYAPIEVPPSGIDGVGEYSVGTLMTQVFYNLNLSSLNDSKVEKGMMYYAVCTLENGSTFTTPPMYCLEAGDAPKFGLTKDLLKEGHGQPYSIEGNATPYNILADLEQVEVSYALSAPQIGTVELISNATGKLIATKIGTPHLMGFMIDGSNPNLYPGLDNLSVCGIDVKTEKKICHGNLKCVDASNPVVLLQNFMY
ncbi:hypothetical protein [Aureibacter tunicatorum]|uniref:Uncharacterized protein n=1 Tax=Aureibacter tunicatorum TaxID=866807 RepID=A0AAE3XLZ0_9BACT|nr:hypothetical protein [Aureibacter tunicatorum]MDR6237364.1 hypothetical protein [Aureibacter tunicatorum]BDD06355.1 hypothetical protein AUTU_38380 [Aureibacter tunicatorum]